MRIRCYTLFDITRTGNIHRKPPINGTPGQTERWEKARNTQTNFDTIVQVLLLRSQPENISEPKINQISFDENTDLFGFLYDHSDTVLNYWSFEFTIPHSSVFDDGVNELGYLHSDCDGVPMIKVGTEWDKLPDILDTTPELRNIYFEVISDENE